MQNHAQTSINYNQQYIKEDLIPYPIPFIFFLCILEENQCVEYSQSHTTKSKFEEQSQLIQHSFIEFFIPCTCYYLWLCLAQLSFLGTTTLK